MSFLKKIKKNHFFLLLAGILSSLLLIVVIFVVIVFFLRISKSVNLSLPLLQISNKDVVKISDEKGNIEKESKVDLPIQEIGVNKADELEARYPDIVIDQGTNDMTSSTQISLISNISEDIYMYHGTTTEKNTIVYKENLRTKEKTKIIEYYSKPEIKNIEKNCEEQFTTNSSYFKNNILTQGTLSMDKTKVVLVNRSVINILDLKTRKLRKIFEANDIISKTGGCGFKWDVVGITDNTTYPHNFGHGLGWFSFSYDNRYLSFFIGGYEGGSDEMIDLKENKVIEYDGRYTNNNHCVGGYGGVIWSPVKNVAIGAGPGAYMCAGLHISDEKDVSKMIVLDKKLYPDTYSTFGSANFSKDGNDLLVYKHSDGDYQDGAIQLVDLVNMKIKRLVTSTPYWKSHKPTFSNDEKKIYYLGEYRSDYSSKYSDEWYLYEYNSITKKSRTLIGLPGTGLYDYTNGDFKFINENLLLINGFGVCKSGAIGCGKVYHIIDLKKNEIVYTNTEINMKGNLVIDFTKN